MISLLEAIKFILEQFSFVKLYIEQLIMVHSKNTHQEKNAFRNLTENVLT